MDRHQHIIEAMPLKNKKRDIPVFAFKKSTIENQKMIS